MAAVCIHAPTIGALKLALKEIFPAVKSAHMSEAIAFALGFQTNAAMRPKLSDEQPTRASVLRDGRLVQRLSELGYSDLGEFNFEDVDLPSSSPAAALRLELNVEGLVGMGIANTQLYRFCLSLQQRGIKLPPFISMKSLTPLLEEAGLSDDRSPTFNHSTMTQQMAEFDSTIQAIGSGAENTRSIDQGKTTSFAAYAVDDPSVPGAPNVADLRDIVRKANPLHLNLSALEAKLPFVAGGTGKSMLLSQTLRAAVGADPLRPRGHAVMAGGKMVVVDLDDPY